MADIKKCGLHGQLTFCGDNDVTYCSNCGEPIPLPPATATEGEAKELVEKFAATIHMASGMRSTLAAKQCAIIHLKLMIEAESEGEIIPHGIERIRHYQKLIKQIEKL